MMFLRLAKKKPAARWATGLSWAVVRAVVMLSAAGVHAYPTPSLDKELIPPDMPREVRELVEQLYSDNEITSAGAAKRLGEMGPAAVSAAPFLASMLDGHFAVPAPNAAAQALVRMGTGAFDAVAVAASSTGADARRRAMLVLARIDGPRAAPLIVEMFAAGLGDHPAWGALRVAGSSARDYVFRALESSDSALRRGAVRAILAFSSVRASYHGIDGHSSSGRPETSWCDTQGVVERLLRAAGDADMEVRLGALQSLAQVSACTDRKMPLSDALRAALNDPEAAVRLAVVGVMVRTDETDQTKYDAVRSLLSDRNLKVRTEAVAALSDLPTERPRTVPLLAGLLKDDEPAIRQKAAEGLGELRATEVEESLLAALKDQARPVQIAAAKALGTMGEKAGLKALMDLARQAPDGMVRLECVRSLSAVYRDCFEKARGKGSASLSGMARLKETGQLDAIFQTLSEAMADPLADIHLPAIQGLVRTPMEARKDVVPLLVSAINSPNIETRKFVMLYLAGSGIRDERLLEPLHERALKEPDEWPHVRGHTCTVLGQLGDTRSLPVLEHVLRNSGYPSASSAFRALMAMGQPGFKIVQRGLGDPDPRVRETVAKSLAQNLGNPKVNDFVKAALTSDDQRLREGAKRAAASLPQEARTFESFETRLRAAILGGGEAWRAHLTKPHDEILPAATMLLKDSNPDVRAAAAALLGATRDHSAVAALCQALTDEAAQVRVQACESLGQLGDRAAAPALIAALRNLEEGVREAAADALGRLGDQAAAEPLIKALASRDNGVRRAAARSLGRLGGAPAGKVLRDVLAHDPDWRVRRAAASALARAENMPEAPALIAAIEDEHWAVRLAAHEALVAITRQKLAAEPEIWRTWWERQGGRSPK